MSEPFPVVNEGDVVYFWKEVSQPRPNAAIVTRVLEGGRVSLSILAYDRATLVIDRTTAVPHRDDPSLHDNPVNARYGFWDLRDCDKASRLEIEDTRKRLTSLEALLNSINAAPFAPAKATKKD